MIAFVSGRGSGDFFIFDVVRECVDFISNENVSNIF